MDQKRSAFLRRCLDRAKSTPNIDTANATRSSIASQAGASKESRSSRESIKNSNTFPEPPCTYQLGPDIIHAIRTISKTCTSLEFSLAYRTWIRRRRVTSQKVRFRKSRKRWVNNRFDLAGLSQLGRIEVSRGASMLDGGQKVSPTKSKYWAPF